MTLPHSPVAAGAARRTRDGSMATARSHTQGTGCTGPRFPLVAATLGLPQPWDAPSQLAHRAHRAVQGCKGTHGAKATPGKVWGHEGDPHPPLTSLLHTGENTRAVPSPEIWIWHLGITNSMSGSRALVLPTLESKPIPPSVLFFRGK